MITITVQGLFEEFPEQDTALALIHEVLAGVPDPKQIPVREYTQRLVELIYSTYLLDAEQIVIIQKVEDGLIQSDVAVPYGLILTELLTNSLLWGFPDGKRGTVKIELGHQDRSTILTFSDDGVDLPDEIDPHSPNSLGLDLVNVLTGQLGGTLESAEEKQHQVQDHLPRSCSGSRSSSLSDFNQIILIPPR